MSTATVKPDTLYSRTSNGAGCPFCSGLKVSVTNSLPAALEEVPFGT